MAFVLGLSAWVEVAEADTAAVVRVEAEVGKFVEVEVGKFEEVVMGFVGFG